MLVSFFVSLSAQAADVAQMTQADLENLDAKFSTTKCEHPCKKPVRLDWWMMRRGEQVEVRNLYADSQKPVTYGEIWRFSPQEKISHLYLMHDDKRAIEYLFDDLKILGVPSSVHQWQFISQLMTDQELQSLTKSNQNSQDFQDLKTEAYTGKVKGVAVDVLWIPSLRIPEKIVYHHPTSDVTVVIDKLFHHEMLKNSDAPLTNPQDLEAYQRVSYVDIGDMEQDADAQAWIVKAHYALGLDGQAHHHH